MSGQQPLVSVIIPAFDSREFLANAVSSVRAQSYNPLEIIIIDDGSTDGTGAVVDSLGQDIKTASQPNQGPAAARNHGLNLARGAFIAFLDADDQWTKGKLSSQVRRLLEEPALDAIIGATQRVQAPATGGSTAGNKQLEAVGAVWMIFSIGASLFRREVFTRVGMFDESMRQGEDIDWFMRAREAGVSIGISNDVVQLYRIHANNMTRNLADKDRFFLAAMKKSLDRRRAGGTEATELPPVAGLAGFKMEPEGDR